MDTNIIDNLTEWAQEFREKQHPASLTLFRAIEVMKRAKKIEDAAILVVNARRQGDSWDILKDAIGGIEDSLNTGKN